MSIVSLAIAAFCMQPLHYDQFKEYRLDTMGIKVMRCERKFEQCYAVTKDLNYCARILKTWSEKRAVYNENIRDH